MRLKILRLKLFFKKTEMILPEVLFINFALMSLRKAWISLISGKIVGFLALLTSLITLEKGKFEIQTASQYILVECGKIRPITLHVLQILGKIWVLYSTDKKTNEINPYIYIYIERERAISLIKIAFIPDHWQSVSF